jgi:acyl carrier protein
LTLHREDLGTAPRKTGMDIRSELLKLVDTALNLNGRGLGLTDETPLLGSLPELDSMGVVTLITELENRLGLSIEDDEIDGSVFATFGSLLAFVQDKV